MDQLQQLDISPVTNQRAVRMKSPIRPFLLASNYVEQFYTEQSVEYVEQEPLYERSQLIVPFTEHLANMQEDHSIFEFVSTTNPSILSMSRVNEISYDSGISLNVSQQQEQPMIFHSSYIHQCESNDEQDFYTKPIHCSSLIDSFHTDQHGHVSPAHTRLVQDTLMHTSCDINEPVIYELSRPCDFGSVEIHLDEHVSPPLETVTYANEMTIYNFGNSTAVLIVSSVTCLLSLGEINEKDFGRSSPLNSFEYLKELSTYLARVQADPSNLPLAHTTTPPEYHHVPSHIDFDEQEIIAVSTDRPPPCFSHPLRPTFKDLQQEQLPEYEETAFRNEASYVDSMAQIASNLPLVVSPADACLLTMRVFVPH